MSSPAHAFPSPINRQRPQRKLNWRKLEGHLADVGALHAGVYRLLRGLVPGAVLSGYWLWKHPGLIFQGKAWWYMPRVSLLEIAMLIAATLLWRMTAVHRQSEGNELISGEISASLTAGFLSALLILPGVWMRFGAAEGIRVSAGFFAAASLLSIALVAAACLIGWFSMEAVIGRREVLIVGSGPAAQAVFEELNDSPVYHVAGVLDDDFLGSLPQAEDSLQDGISAPDGSMRDRYLGGLDRLDTLLREHPISIVFCALPVKSMYTPIQKIIEVCERIGVEVRHPSHLFQTRIARLDRGVDSGRSYSILRMVRQDSSRYVKRAMDVAGASVLLVLSVPFMLAAAVAVKLTSPGPVFFAQSRYGLHRRRFRIFKMRTMVQDAEALQTALESRNELGGPVFKIRRDPRITRVGALLRKTSIDELPQLWNVLRGDMSLVGPRPLAVRDVLRIEDSAQLRRFSVKPGITCIWQMSGRNNTDFAGWIRQDLDYIDRWSLLLDLRILIGTVPAVLRGHGAM
jgi:exopolysaccharide biosynthesis polyprenyl glycosylphosphotransferase